MTKGRLEAFSDGVIAILITIMVLELRPPHEITFESLRPLVPTLLSYVMSFVFLGIYWANHHHMLQSVSKVTGGALWANLHLLFWLSLVPFTTAWMGESHFAKAPVACYGLVLIASAIAYYILSRIFVRNEGPDSHIARALGKDFKGRLSVVLYSIAVLAAFMLPVVSCVIYMLVALIWLVPDRRIERIHREA